ncbi:MAG: hypothetical protein ACI9GH_000227 [Candidatus Paceibacteria bacterium]|jgi:hypothetical protein
MSTKETFIYTREKASKLTNEDLVCAHSTVSKNISLRLAVNTTKWDGQFSEKTTEGAGENSLNVLKAELLERLDRLKNIESERKGRCQENCR